MKLYNRNMQYPRNVVLSLGYSNPDEGDAIVRRPRTWAGHDSAFAELSDMSDWGKHYGCGVQVTANGEPVDIE